MGRWGCRMNSTSRAFGRWPACAGRGIVSAKADAWCGAPREADFNRRDGPMGRWGCRMNSTSRAFGRWPACAGRGIVSAKADAWCGAPREADFNRRDGPMGRWGCRMNSTSWAFGRWPAGAGRGFSRRRRPTEGAQRLGRPVSNRRVRPVAGLRRPKGGFHAGEGRHPARSAQPGRFQSVRRPTPGAQRLTRPISIGVKGQRG